MLLMLMRANLLITLFVWFVLYCSDYALTLLGAQWRARQTLSVTTQGSYELNNYFVADIDKRRVISIRFLVALGWSSLLLALLWYLAQLDPIGNIFFEIGVGGMILIELAIHMRHFRNLFIFRHKSVPGEMQGTAVYSRRYIFWMSALELFLFALLYLVLLSFTGQLFFLGGVISCSATALRHRLRTKREPLLN